MRNIGLALGLAAIFAAGAANATPSNVVYDTITGGQSSSDGGAIGLTPSTTAVAGPLGDSFSVSGPTQLDSVTLRLLDPTPGDGGSVLVYLVPTDPVRNAPWTNGTNMSTTLTGAVQLGTIADSTLPSALTGDCSVLTACDTTLMTSASIGTAGMYWIELVSSAMSSNGANGDPSGAEWEYASFKTPLTGGIGTAGEYLSWENYINGPPQGLTANNLVSANGSFEMTLNTPEPASLAILGAGLMGLGFGRSRRRTKTPAV